MEYQKMRNKKTGFTLIEVLIGLTLFGMATTGIIISQTEESKSKKIQKYINESYDIVRAVDHRLAVDGYDPSLWNTSVWNNESEIVQDLIKKELTSKYLTNCPNGAWDPVLNTEHQTKLISCNHWEQRIHHGEVMNAELVNDAAGFIQSFNLYINYPFEDDFKENFLDLKKALNEAELNINQELSGSHYIDMVSLSTLNDITATECVTNFNDCGIKLSIDRNGGNEYLRADGGNSMIGEHLTFIEAKGQAPMKCVRWANTSRDGTGGWSLEPNEECGIGIYKNDPHPVMVDVVADTGTFSSLLLNKQCKVYTWNGSNVVDSGTTSPCGIMNNGTEIYQVVEYSAIEEATIGKLNVSLINIKDILSDKIDVNTLNVMNKLNSYGIVDFNNIANFNDVSNFNDVVNVNNESNFYDTSYFNSETEFSDKATFNGSVHMNDKTHIDSLNIKFNLNLKNVHTVGGSCVNNGAIARDYTGKLLNCVNKTWQTTESQFAPEVIYEGNQKTCIDINKTGYYIAYTHYGTSSTYVNDLSEVGHGSSMTSSNSSIGVYYNRNTKKICGQGTHGTPQIKKLMWLFP